ncbi:hypothetical protein [Calothrix sp. PCC 6303]|uniref:hypothetical protein n=1 Tax=Calothrix sp. PCC 6303 TaxID=1170562 RepID=UPI0003083263|nr:hypothetical protein [Calothrix sp. PCC 6303]
MEGYTLEVSQFAFVEFGSLCVSVAERSSSLRDESRSRFSLSGLFGSAIAQTSSSSENRVSKSR